MKPALLPILAATAAVLCAGAASSQAPAPAKGTGCGSSKDPIDISARNTDVFQPQHQVVYTGEVEALQGQQRMRTPKLTLYFA